MSTLKDVAERAGVTVTTVSRVINERGYISEKTRKRVHDAMREIGYRPNEVARSLSRKNSNVIGVITPQIDHPYYSKLVGEIEAQAAGEKCKIILCCTNNGARHVSGLMEMHCAEDILLALRDESDTDGIFAGNDLIAAEALRACAASGRTVPGDIKIIGFGDTGAASLTIPPLSSVRQPLKEMARLSVQNILKKRRGEVVPSRMVLPVDVVERETVE